MEENSSAMECLILFYIDMKQVLKTKQMTERVFIDQMVKHCRETGFNSYSDEEIKTAWRNLVSKYSSLKSKGTVEEKESWKYFEILDSCYEQSDFHNGMYPRFSEEMIWFLVECFLKRKALKKTQKQSSIVNEIHKEFLQCGYLYITKQDIENKWRNLNLKYEKVKYNSESLNKWPYLQALSGFHKDDGRHFVNMIFTRELTEILIERFTEKKITCVIHGYDSDQVLTEIQSEFKDLGFLFSKEDIKEKWRRLTNVYKFLIVRGSKDTSWIYFNAMRNHFKNDYLFPSGRINQRINHQNDSKARRLRQRSKSVGSEFIKAEFVEPSLVVQLEKVSPSHKLKNEKSSSTKKKSTKRSSDGHKRSKSRKKLKFQERSKPSQQNNVDPCQITKKYKNENQSSEISTGYTELFQNGSQLRKLSFDITQERRDSTDLGSPTGQVHIINIDHSDIDRTSGNLTINLPSISKQFSDNEFLPLKKRLRIDGDNVDKDSEPSIEIKDGFRGYPPTQTLLMDARENKHVTEENMAQIMERINRENSQTYASNNISGNDISTNYCGSDEFNTYQNFYGNLGQQCLIVPKEELQDNLSIQNYNAPSAVAQPPVLLLVIKVDGSNNPLKDSTPIDNSKMDGSSNPVKSSPSENKTDKKTSDSDKQKSGQSTELSQTSNNFVKPVSPKGKTIILSKKKDLVPLEADCSETSAINKNNSEVVPDLVNSTSSQISSCNPDIVTENKEVTVNNATLNNTEGHIETSETLEVFTIDDSGDGQFGIINNLSDTQTVQEIIFHEPLAVGDKNEIPTKLKVIDNTSVTVTENSVLPQVVKPPGKISLPVKGGGKLKEIFISPRELNKIAKWKPQNCKLKDAGVRKQIEATKRKTAPEFKFVSQVIKPATNESVSENKSDVASQSVDQNPPVTPQPIKFSSKLLGTNSFTHGRTGKNEEFENESVMSEAIGDDDGLKDNLLATVIDFQEQNNQEFIEIKNLMKQNNLLQRETNRLLRIMLEKQ